MRETVRDLREGWYGTGTRYPEGDLRFKKPVDCSKLWKKSLSCATTKFIPLCTGISGTIYDLTVDSTYVPEPVRVPIDTLVVDLTNEDDESDEFIDAISAVNEIMRFFSLLLLALTGCSSFTFTRTLP